MEVEKRRKIGEKRVEEKRRGAGTGEEGSLMVKVNS